ncbi:unnamed protein product [Phaedon cochleariae]|uniref:Uncharacterized protein n=1 Tax=Phaedon cochleariae TaxID=80249 RepID=A0A9N9SN37_PHACE|nr:unnamed protein product [Phaedon cochleariae]
MSKGKSEGKSKYRRLLIMGKSTGKTKGKEGECSLEEKVDVKPDSELFQLIEGINKNLTGVLGDRIASDNGLLAEQRLSRKQLKLFIEEELEYLGIVFSKPKRVNEPQRISLKVSADVALAITEEEYKDAEHDMKILHKASNILRKAVLKCEKWTFTGSFDDVNVEEVVPEEFVSETIRGSIPKGYRPKNPVLNRETATTGRSVTDLWSYKNEDLIWMIAHTSSLSPYVDSDVNEYQDTNCILSNQEQETPTNNLKFTNAVPIWSAFNSITSEKPRKETRICVLPLIDSSPTKVETQLSLMNKLEKVTSNITPGKKTVVTLDLGLYRHILKLSMAKKDISKNWILRPGELHIVMAMLRCIGRFIDGTGLGTTLTVLYDETVSQILSGKCVRRAINAHTSLRLALFKCVFDEFVKDNSVIEENIEPQLNKTGKRKRDGEAGDVCRMPQWCENPLIQRLQPPFGMR